jgi:hypothetical protein
VVPAVQVAAAEHHREQAQQQTVTVQDQQVAPLDRTAEVAEVLVVLVALAQMQTILHFLKVETAQRFMAVLTRAEEAVEVMDMIMLH